MKRVSLLVILSIMSIACVGALFITEKAFADLDAIEIYIDGKVRSHEDLSPSIQTADHEMEWETYAEKPSWHTVTAKVTDLANNSSHDSMVVLVDNRGGVDPLDFN